MILHKITKISQYNNKILLIINLNKLNNLNKFNKFNK